MEGVFFFFGGGRKMTSFYKILTIFPVVMHFLLFSVPKLGKKATWTLLPVRCIPPNNGAIYPFCILTKRPFYCKKELNL